LADEALSVVGEGAGGVAEAGQRGVELAQDPYGLLLHTEYLRELKFKLLLLF
jgi:hypothetical protein